MELAKMANHDLSFARRRMPSHGEVFFFKVKTFNGGF